ncbi:4-oxalocrotonate tautomerase [Candidatus Heimdallarchaeota archaeon]|nr:MAG: 4-oxalocrotonate tautomerase [Candidatus Heimdallarchaeota archaeon]
MPVVQVQMWEGRTEEQIRDIIAGITEVLVKQGSKPESVRVIISEYPKSRWGMNGKPAS